MLVIVVEQDKAAKEKVIRNELKEMQDIVDGYIEVTYPWNDNVALVCNEEGKSKKLPRNRAIFSEENRIIDIINGTFFIVGLDENGEFTSLTRGQALSYKALFSTVHKFKYKDGCMRVYEVLESA